MFMVKWSMTGSPDHAYLCRNALYRDEGELPGFIATDGALLVRMNVLSTFLSDSESPHAR